MIDMIPLAALLESADDTGCSDDLIVVSKEALQKVAACKDLIEAAPALYAALTDLYPVAARSMAGTYEGAPRLAFARAALAKSAAIPDGLIYREPL